MATRTSDSLPAALEKARERFEAWRETRTQGDRIPERLWTLAVKTAEKQGPYKTSRALRLDYMDLKQRMPGGVVKAGGKSEAPSFVEVRRTDALSTAECVAWIEDCSGARMRLELRGLDAAQIGALARSFAGGSR
jgi:hypothetical protein